MCAKYYNKTEEISNMKIDVLGGENSCLPANMVLSFGLHREAIVVQLRY